MQLLELLVLRGHAKTHEELPWVVWLPANLCYQEARSLLQLQAECARVHQAGTQLHHVAIDASELTKMRAY